GINAAAIRKISADDRVIDADQTSKRANSQYNWQRRKPGSQKRQADHVRLACAPIAVEQCGSAFPVQVTRPVHTRTRVENNILYQFCHCLFVGLSIAGSFTGKLFLPATAEAARPLNGRDG